MFIANFLDPLLFHLSGVPYILFRPYKWEELLNIICQSPLCIQSFDGAQSEQQKTSVPTEDDRWVWSRYCTALWESFGKSTAQDLVSFRWLAEKLWRLFAISIEDGSYGVKDFSKLMIAKRQLFQSESVLQRNIAITSGDSASKNSAKGWLQFRLIVFYGIDNIKFLINYHIIQNTSFALPIWLPLVRLGKIYFFLLKERRRRGKKVHLHGVDRESTEK